MFRSLTIAIAVILLVGCGGPQRLRPGWQGEGRGWFEAEWIQGYASDGSPVGTLSVSVPHRYLIFFADDGAFESRYRIRCVQRARGRSLRSQEWGGVVSVESYAQTRSEDREEKTVQFTIDPQAGQELELLVSLRVEGTQREATRVLQGGQLSRGESGLELGELRLYSERSPGELPAEPISLAAGEFPDGRRFEHVAGGDLDYSTGAPWLLVRVFDLRGGGERNSFPLEISVTPGRESNQLSVAIPRHGVENALLVPLPKEFFAFGVNEIQAQLEDDLSGRLQVHNLGVDLEEPASWRANLQQLEGLATDHAMERLRAAGEGAREATWMQFWDGLDPTPDDGDNERLREHYRRVQYARHALRDGASEGSLSDRGRIYVLHGEPDRVEDVPPRWDDANQWQLWYYDALRLVFYFRQAQGGFYRLVQSERA